MKKCFRAVIIGIFLMSGVSAFASGEVPVTSSAKATISGKVVDNLTGEFLAGVAVSLEGLNTVVYSDLDGNFTISDLTPGTYNVVLSLISYKKSLIENLEIKPNEHETINAKLDTIR